MKKNFLKHIFLSFFMVLCWGTILVCMGAYFFLTTTWGARVAAKYLIKAYIPFCDVVVGGYQGTIEKGLLLHRVTISHIPDLKAGIITAQEIYIQIPLTHWSDVSAKVVNAKLVFPVTDTIIFNGTVIQNQIRGNCYANSIDAHQIVSALGYDDLAKNIQGSISHIDFNIQGRLNSPRFTGHFFVDKFSYRDTRLSDGFGRLDLTIKSLGANPSMEGFMIMDSAVVQTNKVNVDLTTSKVDFKGDVSDLSLEIYGSSKVEDINIDMAIKGTLKKPQLTFSSDPPLTQDEILYVLVTGKSWSAINHEESGGFGLRKKLSDAFNVGMDVEEMPSQIGRPQAPGYSRTIEGQMNITDKFSVNIARKFLPAENAGTAPTGSSPSDKENDTELYLQYKKRF